MIRKTLTILSLIGLLLSVGLWGVSCGEGWSHTHFYIGEAGEEIGITFLCFDGRIGWDESSDMSDSVLSPDHGVSLWLSTLVLTGSFLFCVFHRFCQRVVSWTMRGARRTARAFGTVLGYTVGERPRILTILSLIGLLLSVGLWGVSYYGVGITSSTAVIVAAYYGSVYVSRWSDGRLTGLVPEQHRQVWSHANQSVGTPTETG